MRDWPVNDCAMSSHKQKNFPCKSTFSDGVFDARTHCSQRTDGMMKKLSMNHFHGWHRTTLNDSHVLIIWRDKLKNFFMFTLLILELKFVQFSVARPSFWIPTTYERLARFANFSNCSTRKSPLKRRRGKFWLEFSNQGSCLRSDEKFSLQNWRSFAYAIESYVYRLVGNKVGIAKKGNRTHISPKSSR